MFIGWLIEQKKQTSVILQCTLCKSHTTYSADLFRQSHLKEYKKNGYVTQYCDCDDSCNNPPHIIKGLYTESISRLNQEKSILRDLEGKKWG